MPRRQANLNGPNQLRDIVGMDFLSSSAVKTLKNSMQMIRTASRGALAQALAQFLRTLRTWKKSFQKRAQVQSNASNHDGQVAPLVDFPQHLPCLAGIFSSGHVLGGINAIE